MLIPIRCFTCGKTLADKYDWYVQEVLKLQKKTDEKDAKKSTTKKKGGADTETSRDFDQLKTGPIMDKLGLTRICCRRHMLTTVDMMEMI